MRGAFLVAVGLSSTIALATPPASQPGASTPQPPYTPVRWYEDYRYLRTADPADIIDRVKYIPINEEGDWYLSFGGQARYRYEFFNDASFGAGDQDDDGFHLLRLMAHVDAHVGSNLRFFVQGISANSDHRDGGEMPGIDEDDLDLHQAFGDLMLPIGDAKLLLRGGRQNLLYGAQRLISPLDWTNTRRTFDGGKISMSTGQNVLDVFYVNPVVVDEGNFNEANDDDFAGAYNVLSLPNVFEEGNSKLDTYILYLDRKTAAFDVGAADEERATAGLRFSSNPKPWDFDFEAAYQFGEFGDGDVSAWMFATEIGYALLAQEPITQPRAFLGFDIASGDDEPGDDDLGTFNQLFPLGHAYFGYIDVVGRQNIIDLHPGVELTLLKDREVVKKLSLRGDYHLFWRQSTDDALYSASGAILRSGADTDERFIGSEVDLLINWQVERHLLLYFGCSHFFAGDFIDETGPEEDIDFAYMGVQYTF